MGSGMAGIDISRTQNDKRKFLVIEGQIDLNPSALDYKDQIFFMTGGKNKGIFGIILLGKFSLEVLILRTC